MKIFSRDNWACKFCGVKDESLHVHHIFYSTNRNPWEIHDGFLITLCESCHTNEKEPDEDMTVVEEIKKSIGDFLDTLWSNGWGASCFPELTFVFSEATEKNLELVMIFNYGRKKNATDKD